MNDALDLNAVNASIRQKIREAGSGAEVTALAPVDATHKSAVGVKMKRFPDSVAVMPNVLARAAIFGLPGDSRARQLLENVVVPSGDPNKEIRYNGYELCAGDETLYLLCVRMGREFPIGHHITTTAAQLLGGQGLKDSGGMNGSRAVLTARLKRLSIAHFTVVTRSADTRSERRPHVMTSGLLKFWHDEATGRLAIRLDPMGAELYLNLSYQTWAVRLRLQSDMARRLFSYVCGHQLGRPVSICAHDLQSQLGHRGRMQKFLPSLGRALCELERNGEIVAGSSSVSHAGRRGRYRVCWRRPDKEALATAAEAVHETAEAVHETAEVVHETAEVVHETAEAVRG